MVGAVVSRARLPRRRDRPRCGGRVHRGAREPAGSTDPGLVVTLGVEMVMAAQRDAAFRNAIDRAALVTCDSIGLLLASRLRGGPLHERVTGVELVDALAARSASAGDVRLYLLGGAGDTAVARGRRAAPRVSGRDRQRRARRLLSSRAKATRSPRRSARAARTCCWPGSVFRSKSSGSSGISPRRAAASGIGVGGSLDVYAGNVVRAPAFFRRTGLEWAYRLGKEPRRWRRQLALPRFALAALGEAVTAGKAGKKQR